MTDARRRTLLYGAGLVLAGGLLFAGFGITVPPNPSVRLNGATALAQVGNYGDAVAICDEVLAEHPDSVDAIVYKATFLGMAGRHEDAVAAYDDALHRVDGDVELRRDLLQDRAGVLLEAGRTDDFARARAELAAERDDHRVRVLDGCAAAKRGDWPAAVEAFEAAVAQKREDERIRARLWNAYMTRGREALAQRRFPEARDAFDRASALFPQATNAHLQGMEVRLAMNDPAGALELARKVGPETPGVASLVFRGATALLEAGRADEALDALQGAFVADREGTRALFMRESAWEAYREHELVRSWLKTDGNSEGSFDGVPPSDS